MNTNPKVLFLIEPNSARCLRWLQESTALAVRLYWDLFISLPVTIFSLLFAVMAIMIGLLDIAHHPYRCWSDLPPIGFSVAFLASGRLRAFVWAFLACFVGWLVLIVSLLLPIVGPDFRVETLTAKILLGTVYLLPPLIAALYIDRARHCRA